MTVLYYMYLYYILAFSTQGGVSLENPYMFFFISSLFTLYDFRNIRCHIRG